ncbi:MAG TPA: membrane protein insertase YidC [Longimicrobiales bacterium]
MDSRRFLLAVVLMIAVMVVTNIVFPPPPAPETAAPDSARSGTDTSAAPARVGADTSAPVPVPPPVAAVPADTPPTQAADTAGPVQPAAADLPDDTLSVRSPLYEYRIATRGAAIVGAQLFDFPVLQEGREDETVQLASTELPGLFAYRVRSGTRDIPFDALGFTAEPAQNIALATADSLRSVRLSHRGADGTGIDVVYDFDPDEYAIDVRMVVDVPGGQVPNLFISLPRTLARNEENLAEEERALAYVVNNTREGIRSVRLGAIDTERVENGPLHWVAVKSKYFVAGALTHPESQTPFGGLIATPIPEPNAARMEVTLLPGADGTFSFRLYLGPQEPQRLAELGSSFQDVNPFGWRAFRPIMRPLGHAIQWAIYGMHDLLGLGYGWVLILFGILVRIALWPLNAKAMRSQMKTMEIQPKLKEIQTKYKDKPEQLQKEMLRLYKEEGFNPMGGCLPMLVPLPILITLFFVFQSTIAFRGVGFLWLPDLSRADPFFILPILLGVSMFLMQWMSTRSMPEQNPQMKFMMYAMPIFMTVIFLNFASGLNLYYASMNFASIPQQIQISRERRRFQASRK